MFLEWLPSPTGSALWGAQPYPTSWWCITLWGWDSVRVFGLVCTWLMLTSGLVPKAWPLQAQVSHASCSFFFLLFMKCSDCMLHNKEDVPEETKEEKKSREWASGDCTVQPTWLLLLFKHKADESAFGLTSYPLPTPPWYIIEYTHICVYIFLFFKMV